MLFSRDANPFDRPWESWAAVWCNWFLSIPKAQSPAIDTSGKNCTVNQIDPWVWFLGGTFGNKELVKRKFVLPQRRSIFFPILEKEDSFLEDSDLMTEEELATRAKRAMDAVTLLEVEIDGISLRDLFSYRVRSNFFDLNFPANNVYDLVPGITRSVCDGYWIFLRPLSTGKHYLYFHGECSLLEGEKPTERIMNDNVYKRIKKFAEAYRTFRVEVRYEIEVL
jgi:hypothetical protein